MVNGVTVHRFPTASQRVLEYFDLDAKVRLAPGAISLTESRRWVALNGPMCPDLVDAVATTDADVVACYPYLFATTVDAIAVSEVPTVLHPAAHDEPALYLSAFRQSFRNVDGFVYHTQAERDLMEYAFGNGAKPQIVLGLGVNEPAGGGRRGGDLLGLGDRPYLCYLGRVDEHKGCGMLAEYFSATRSATRATWPWPLSGRCRTRPPTTPTSWSPGTVSEADKWDILGGAEVMVNPSAYESFSLVLLEAWSLEVPVLVNASCAATMEHCRAVRRRTVVRVLPLVRGHRGATRGRRGPAAFDWGGGSASTPSSTSGGRPSSIGTPISSRASWPGAAGGRPG